MFNLPYQVALEGALVFIRIGGILFALPFFGDQAVPTRVRILLAVAIAFLIYPILDKNWFLGFPNDLISFTVLVIKELLIGLMIGYVARLTFEALIIAANIVGFQMGFGTASLMMPDAEYMTDAFTAFHRSLVILFFLALDLHYIYISTIADTFRAIPSGGVSLRGETGILLIRMSSEILLIALRLAAPVLVALLFTMSALGLIARVVPQLYVFAMSFSVSFFVGLLVYVASLPFFPEWIKTYFSRSHGEILTIIRSLMP